MEKTTEQMIEERVEKLLQDRKLFDKVLDYVEQGKDRVLNRFLGNDYSHIIQTAYEATVNYDQDF